MDHRIGTTRIAIVEDDESYTEVLKEVVALHPNFEIVAAYSIGLRFITALPNLVADVVLLDINLPKMSGLDCIGEIQKFKPLMRTILLTVHDDTDFILRAFLTGADGYLLKESSGRQIIEAIQDALNGGAPMSPAIARRVVNMIGRNAEYEAAPSDSNAAERLLSTREYEILQLLASGKKYTEIASALHLALPTIKSHVSHIYEKLKVRNKIEAISFLRN